jgi:RNA-directed DNA polymerase
VLADRALQAVTVNALEPEWEARFESRSYGFRPGRGCHDAIEAIYKVGRGPNPTRRWVLDADLAAAFDRIDHTHLLDQLGTFPARDRIAAWLTAGVVEKGQLTPTEEGTPQGGVISPVLLNVALHGMEEAAGAVCHATGSRAGWSVAGAPVLVRYADDLVAMCVSREQAQQVKARLTTWLAPRGLRFNEDKTRIVTLDDGHDFLGFTIRRFRGKLLIKPSRAAMRRIRARLTAEMRALRGANVDAVLQRLNPIIRGWSAYYRSVVSSEAFHALDAHMWRLAYKWARFRHPNKSKRWVTVRYFGMFNTSRRDRWVLGDRESGAYLTKFAWTKIVRHQIVAGTASPDDPDLADYWAKRQRRRRPPLDRGRLRLLLAQHGRCPICGGLLLFADREPQDPREWKQWLKATRTAIRKEAILAENGHGTSRDTVALLHAHCRRRHLGTGRNREASAAREPSGLA